MNFISITQIIKNFTIVNVEIFFENDNGDYRWNLGNRAKDINVETEQCFYKSRVDKNVRHLFTS